MKKCYKCDKKYQDTIKFCPFDGASLYFEVINNRYKLVKLLGEGGMGEIFLGEDLKLERKVAIKILFFDSVNNIEALNRFESEAKAAAKINSPNIVQIYDFDKGEDGRYFIIMEYLPGDDLFIIMRREKILHFNRIISIFKQLSNVLDLAHSEGIIHRDLKPSNIFIIKNNDEEIVKVIDFGIAKIKQPIKILTPKKKLENTVPGIILGTPTYMSPEQAKGYDVDHRTDIFALGVILYECLTGSSAFKHYNVSDLNGIVRVPSITLEKMDQILPAEINKVILKAMAENPENRYNSCKDFSNDLIDAMNKIEDKEGLRKSLLEHITEPLKSEDKINTAPIRIKDSADIKEESVEKNISDNNYINKLDKSDISDVDISEYSSLKPNFFRTLQHVTDSLEKDNEKPATRKGHAVKIKYPKPELSTKTEQKQTEQKQTEQKQTEQKQTEQKQTEQTKKTESQNNALVLQKDETKDEVYNIFQYKAQPDEDESSMEFQTSNRKKIVFIIMVLIVLAALIFMIAFRLRINKNQINETDNTINSSKKIDNQDDILTKNNKMIINDNDSGVEDVAEINKLNKSIDKTIEPETHRSHHRKKNTEKDNQNNSPWNNFIKNWNDNPNDQKNN